MAQSTPTNSYCSRASFKCPYMHHIEKYVFQQESAAPGLGLLFAYHPTSCICTSRTVAQDTALFLGGVW